MPPKTASSSSRWLQGLGGLVGLLVVSLLVWLAVSRSRSADAARGADGGAPTGAPAPRSPPPVDVLARPRAGIAGQVLDPDRKPIANASVCAWAQRASGLTTAQTRVPRCATTDGNGAYTLSDLFPATPLAVSASAATFPPQGFHGKNGDDELRLAEGEQRAGVDFVLRGGGVPIKGRVNDVTGGVVPGALVVTEELDLGGRGMATSDAKGEFTLWVAPGQVRIGATATGYAPGRTSGPAPGHFFALHLVPGATLVGRAVIAGSEKPVVGATIEAIQVEGGGSRNSTRTDEEGRFRVEGLTPGRFRVEATAEGREGYSRSSVTLGMGETSGEVLVELDPAYVVRGRVVDKAGAPCTAGQVTITDSKQNEFSQATIEPDGWARMASVIPGNYRVEVSCKGHVERDDYPMIAIKDRDLPEQTWEVDKGAGVRVLVVDGQGKPVTSASVNAYPTGRGEGSGGSTDHAEPDGAFLVSGLKPGTYNVMVRAHDGSRGEKEITASASREERVTVELPLTGSIEGIVEDDDHRPIANIQVSASGPSRASARSLDDGTFLLTGLPSGEYVVNANERTSFRRPPPGEEAKRPVVKVTVAAPGRAKARVTVEKRGGVIEGRVMDGNNQPVTDAFIDYARAIGSSTGVPRYGGSNRAPVITDTEGKFKIDMLADGEYNLRAYRKGGGEATADHVKTGTQGLSLKLGDGGSLSGSLTSRNTPVERFTLSVREKKTQFNRQELFFHAKGAFALRDLPPGTYFVVAETPDGTATTEITLAEGEQRSGLALTLTLRGVVEGRLVEVEGGGAIASMRLGVEGDSQTSLMNGDTYRNNTSGPDGRFHLEGVLPGKWHLTVTPAESGGFDTVSVPLEVKEGGGVTDAGAIRIPRRRLKPGERPGDLGLAIKDRGEPGDAAAPLEVSVAHGAAEEAGIKVGDVVVSVDGFDVSGANRYLFAPLTTVAAGRAVSIGLGRGGAVSVVARGPGGSAE